ncbi:uncharacterized protein LOC142597892 [Dermatophagoides farinae]|uniref:uncharacterized protein LOC142597892 n=1 Tax=Dermatophagoides farinae TaxID=6954 RepID=UPI003F60CEF8
MLNCATCHTTWEHKNYISNFSIIFEGEEGVDEGGLTREFYRLLSKEIFNPDYCMFVKVSDKEFDQIKTTELIPNGNNIPVTDDNKLEYVNLLCEFKCLRGIKEQVTAFMKGFNSLIPRFLISIFDEMEIELLICGLPDISIDDLQAHTIYSNYVKEDKTIIHFWEVLREFDTNQVASFLQFVTGSGKVPLGGFKNLMGNNGIQYFTITKVDNVNRLPTAHTCFNQLELPSYESKEILKTKLLQAIMEGRDGFGFT